MLRISENLEDPKVVRLRLDGTIDAVAMAELKEICCRYQNDNGKVILLDFAGVVFMNHEAAENLVELRSVRLRLINCSPFIEMLLATVEK
jgi:anti-anti-sigma regulatory factor